MNELDKKVGTHDLDGLTAFLSGPIDRVDDDGVGWRKELRKKCKNAKLPLKFFDPTDKPEGLGSEVGDEKKRIIPAKEKTPKVNIITLL